MNNDASLEMIRKSNNQSNPIRLRVGRWKMARTAAFVDAAMFYLQWSGINGESEEEIKRNGQGK